jgi:hypothetical protein
MLTINDGGSLLRALSMPLDIRLKGLLERRAEQLGSMEDNARFVVVEPGDRARFLEEALGFSPLQNLTDGSRFGDPDFTPGWEWIERHEFGWELCFIFTDDGFAHVVLVPDAPRVSAKLLRLCTQFATEQA